jgi:NitT/TauT family transport system substrate-binding protein
MGTEIVMTALRTIGKACAAVLFLLAAAAARGEALKVGVVGTTSDASFFIADAKGYFKAEGLDVAFIRFDSAAKMVVPLGSGELDVGAGATSSALYNAAERRVNIKIVADKGRTARGYPFEAFLVRKDLYESGKVRSFRDLKGLTVAVNSNANSEAVLLNLAVQAGGLAMKDIRPVYLGFPQQPAGFQNGALDAAIVAEPFITYILRQGTAVKLMGVDEFAPDFQNAVTLYGADFARRKPEAARGFMRALVGAMRFYNDALKDAHLSGPHGEEVIAIMVKYAALKDAATYREIVSHGVDPDGRVNVASLKQSWQYFRDSGQIDGKVTVDDVLDLSFVEAAVSALGPYRPAPR